MLYSLPAIGKEAIPLTHFPTRHQAFIFRAAEYVPTEKIASLLNTTVEHIQRAEHDMGLPDYNPGDLWLKRGYITIIRRMWHILPYDQLLELLEMDEPTLALIMKQEDFLDVKLAEKPHCDRVIWRELTEEEAQRTAQIKNIMETLDLSGKKPFAFEYKVPKLRFEGKERFSTRMIYAFSGLYQRAFDMDSREYLPDEQLEAYRDLGVNGIWAQGVLTQIAPFPFDPDVSEGYQARLARMKALTERLDRYGIKLYLYLNEPRSMPLGFFEKHPDLRGHVEGTHACLCTSSDSVQNYLRDSIESICRAVPLLGGFFTITRSENLTGCYSHAGNTNQPCLCPKCKDRGIGEVIAEMMGCLLDGARRVSKEIKIFAWSWGWYEYSEEIIRQLPKEVILLSQSELLMPYEIGGVGGQVIDYSMSIVGPGEHACNEWRIAKECGLEIGAKVQINTTWEASTVPAIPVSPSIEKHIQRLEAEGVKHLLLSWTLGGYPCRNIAAAAKYFYERCQCDPSDSAANEAEKQFVEAFKEFPFHAGLLYSGPQNAGPSTLLFEEPTGYAATMTCFAYDDLRTWSRVYPTEVLEEQFAKLSRAWDVGIGMLPKDEEGEITVMARATGCLFRSSLNQIRFIRARNEHRYADAAEYAEKELEVAREMLALMNQNAAIGYEAANHYYFSKGQITEKIVNCHEVIGHFRALAEKNSNNVIQGM